MVAPKDQKSVMMEVRVTMTDVIRRARMSSNSIRVSLRVADLDQ